MSETVPNHVGQYHITKFLLMEYARPGRIFAGTTLQADVIFFMNTPSSCSASLNRRLGMRNLG
ncbi:hypothetical protein [Mycobacterium lentiflavum]|uniref:hypothetical protein n=1 Tax=Mycobacterium lentiflavum TaxID=141349 RepID=UPI001586CB17|nr:hypothetical protein [Mycobacterium lentiflavum]